MILTTTERARLAERLRASGCVYAEDEAAVLEEAAGGAEALEHLVADRLKGQPLEQVVGWAIFDGRRVRVAPGVFVPRRRSELLVSRAVGLLPAGGVLVELCCGSAAVASAVAHRCPGAVVIAADVDPVAVACARSNLPSGEVYRGDLYDALPADLRLHVDVIVANAPYVPTAELPLMPAEAREHEPRLALDGGADGAGVQRRIAAFAADWLSPTGRLLVETSRHLAPRSMAAFRAAGLRHRLVTDEETDGAAVLGWNPEGRASQARPAQAMQRRAVGRTSRRAEDTEPPQISQRP